MYEKFFGLTTAPFSLTPNLTFVFASRRYREVEEQLQYGIASGEGLLLVTGEPGTGKTLLCRDLIERLERTTARSALLVNPYLTGVEMLAAVLAGFGLTAPATASRKELLDRLNQFLLAQLALGRKCVVVFDEAQHLAPDFLEQLRVLSNLETEDTKLIQIVLVGQPELLDKLRTPQMAQLDQRVSIRCALGDLDEAETGPYIQHRLATAGAQGQIRFTPQAIDDVYRSSHGVPRLVNLICDRALLAAFAAQSHDIRPEHVRKAATTLRGDDPGAAQMPVVARRSGRRIATAVGATLLIAVAAAATVLLPRRSSAPSDEVAFRRALAERTTGGLERDLRAFVAAYPLSRHYDEALLGLAQLERSRGDRAAAIAHLTLVADHAPAGSVRARAAALGAVATFETGDTTNACLRFAADSNHVVAGDTTLTRQVESMTSTCSARTAAAAAVDSTARAAAKADSVRAARNPTAGRANRPKKPLPPPPSVLVPRIPF